MSAFNNIIDSLGNLAGQAITFENNRKAQNIELEIARIEANAAAQARHFNSHLNSREDYRPVSTGVNSDGRTIVSNAGSSEFVPGIPNNVAIGAAVLLLASGAVLLVLNSNGES